MWDSVNGTLLPSGFGSNSPNISFGISPMMGMGMGMGMNGMMPPVPYGGYGMFPGMMGGLPYDTCSFSNPANLPPLKTAGHSFWGEVPTALKVVGGAILALAAFRLFKGKRTPRVKA